MGSRVISDSMFVPRECARKKLIFSKNKIEWYEYLEFREHQMGCHLEGFLDGPQSNSFLNSSQ